MGRPAKRNISWIKAALKDFNQFPESTREEATDALTALAEGGTPDVAKPLTGLSSGMWELAIRSRGDAYRVVYALQLADDIWIFMRSRKNPRAG
jgi:phage-related protein